MNTLKIFDIPLDKSGSNISELKFIFSDDGTNFREIIADSFSFADHIRKTAKKLEPDHKLELWDQAIKYRLNHIFEDYQTSLVDKAKLLLEGLGNPMEVWQYGIYILKSHRKQRRPWALPDGLIKTPDKKIAIEFDHGRDVGKWATQLLKAIRSTASSEIDGVLFCFYLESQSISMDKNFFTDQEFTQEFLDLASTRRKKPIGIMTIDSKEIQTIPELTNEEMIDFFSTVYGPESPKKDYLKTMASRIIAKLRK